MSPSTPEQPAGRRTPLHAEHEVLGARFVDFAGWRMPVRYDSELAEHHAVRDAAGLFDLSHMGEIRVRGAEAGPALDHAVVGHASKIAVGRARYSLLCRPDGGVLDDLIVYRTAESEFLVVANAANADLVLAELRERAAGFAAEVVDDSADTALIALQGPVAARVLAELTDADLDGLRYYASVPARVAGREVLLARTGYTGEDGFELFCPAGDAVPLWRALLDAGRPHGVRPAGLGCRDSLRLEAGMALYGNELTVATNPYQANLGRVVKLDKPADFVGRAALAEIAERGVDTVLVGLTGTGRRAPRHGYPVLDPATGTEIGTVTSGAPSPTLGHPIAMAYVRRQYAAPGTKLAVDVRGRQEAVEVTELPFYRRQRQSP
ncbi:glycine cleavage system aminomethyltransferase GcvT [Gandjariella thermophila]|nr:glycine cleavage system aminomethyltransferase GcvT [Gandjariella thermophila]